LKTYKEQDAIDNATNRIETAFDGPKYPFDLNRKNISAIHANANTLADDIREERAAEDRNAARTKNGRKLACFFLYAIGIARQSIVAISKVQAIESGLEPTPISISSGVNKKLKEARRAQKLFTKRVRRKLQIIKAQAISPIHLLNRAIYVSFTARKEWASVI
jgi:hypothetical protein